MVNETQTTDLMQWRSMIYCIDGLPFIVKLLLIEIVQSQLLLLWVCNIWRNGLTSDVDNFVNIQTASMLSNYAEAGVWGQCYQFITGQDQANMFLRIYVMRNALSDNPAHMHSNMSFAITYYILQ